MIMGETNSYEIITWFRKYKKTRQARNYWLFCGITWSGDSACTEPNNRDVSEFAMCRGAHARKIIRSPLWCWNEAGLNARLCWLTRGLITFWWRFITHAGHVATDITLIIRTVRCSYQSRKRQGYALTLNHGSKKHIALVGPHIRKGSEVLWKINSIISLYYPFLHYTTCFVISWYISFYPLSLSYYFPSWNILFYSIISYPVLSYSVMFYLTLSYNAPW